jgi:hypothetical protein
MELHKKHLIIDHKYWTQSFFLMAQQHLVGQGLLNIEASLTRARGGSVDWGTALQAGRSRVRIPMLSLEFFIDIFLPVDSAFNRNEYQEYFLCRMPWHLNLLEPSGPIQGLLYNFYRPCRNVALVRARAVARNSRTVACRPSADSRISVHTQCDSTTQSESSADSDCVVLSHRGLLLSQRGSR